MKILIGYDGSECADAALDDLRRAGLPKKAAVVVLSAFEDWMPPPASFEILGGLDPPTEVKELARRGLARIKSLMPEWEVVPETAFGSPATAILEKAESWKPDLIVVGSHGRTAAGRFFFGSVSQKLVHESHCAVRVARSSSKASVRPLRIVIGVDGSKGAEAAINVVASRHWPRGSEARLVNACWKIPPATSQHVLNQIAEWIASENAKVKEMTDAAVKKLKQVGLKTSVVVKDEDPKGLLLSEAESWDADCIFVGARGMGRVERFMIGSVSSAVAARAHCSVEVVRSCK